MSTVPECALRESQVDDRAELVERLGQLCAWRGPALGHGRAGLEPEVAPAKTHGGHAGHAAPLRCGQHALRAKPPGERGVVLHGLRGRRDHERPVGGLQLEAEPLGELVVLADQRGVGADPGQQAERAALLVGHHGRRPRGLVGVREQLRYAVDELEQQVGALEQRRALVLAGGLEQRGPGVAGAVAEVRRHHVGRHAFRGETACALAEALQVLLGGPLVVHEPAHHQVDVPAHPRAHVLARGPEAPVLGPVPEAVEDPLGEPVEVRALDDAPDHVTGAGACLHVTIISSRCARAHPARPKSGHGGLCTCGALPCMIPLPGDP